MGESTFDQLIGEAKKIVDSLIRDTEDRVRVAEANVSDEEVDVVLARLTLKVREDRAANDKGERFPSDELRPSELHLLAALGDVAGTVLSRDLGAKYGFDLAYPTLSELALFVTKVQRLAKDEQDMVQRPF